MYASAAVATALAALAPVAYAHGWIDTITANGVNHTLLGPNWIYQTSVQGPDWRPGDQDNGFVMSSTEYINSAAINCHRRNTTGNPQTTLGAYPALGSPVPVAAGSIVNLHWNTWANHPGPTLDYMAKCPGHCNQLTDATQLQWFKIRESGLKPGACTGITGITGSNWEACNIAPTPDKPGSQQVTIPSQLAPGEYVLRHEIIALHGAVSNGGAQMYPLCFDLIVSGSGTFVPNGTLGVNLYTSTDPGILIDIYQSPSLKNYSMPGPPLAPGVTNVP